MRTARKRIFLLAVLGFLLYGGYVYSLGEKDMPPLEDGDLIFQTSWVNQAMAIGLASGSLYIHAGIVKMTDGPSVIEAAAQVKETPLHEWIGRGVLKRFAVYRYKGLTREQAEKLLEAAKTYYGRPYDHYFSFDNDAIYCSELIYLAYKDAGIPAAQPEKIGGLHLNNPFTKALIEQRWQHYPACAGKDITFEQCYDIIMSQDIVTPYHVAADSHFEQIFTNYY